MQKNPYRANLVRISQRGGGQAIVHQNDPLRSHKLLRPKENGPSSCSEVTPPVLLNESNINAMGSENFLQDFALGVQAFKAPT